MQNLGTAIYTSKDKEKARIFWKKIFSSHARQLGPLSPHCQMSIVIPVFSERVDRLKRQIESLRKQKGFLEHFEVIYIVNNDISDGSRKWKESFRRNQEAIAFLRKDHGISLHVIDRSSLGKEIKNCSVGKARNIGIAEASVRYFEQNKDGILFQSDADVRLSCIRHLQRIRNAFLKNPRIFGISGGVIYEFSTDNFEMIPQSKQRDFYRSLVLHFRWHALVYILRSDTLTLPKEATQFSGAHMISRAWASACVEGVPDLPKGEDIAFGENLEKFALHKHGLILPMREKWYVRTALRESSRTAASFGMIFDRILEEGDLYAPSPDAPFFKDFAKKVLGEVVRIKDVSGLRAFLHDEERPFAFSDDDLCAFLKIAHGHRTNDRRFNAYEMWRRRDENKHKRVLGHLYNIRYPRQRITYSCYLQLRAKVIKDKKKKEYLKYFTKHYHNFRFSSS